MNPKYKILMIILFSYMILVAIILYIVNINNVVILISPNISIKYEAKNYKKIEFNSNLRYNVYVDNNFISNDFIKKDDDTFYFNNEIVKNLIAVSNNKTRVLDYEIKELEKEDYQNILESLDIKKYKEMTIAKKMLIDYDNDGQIEEIVVLSNVFVDPFMEDVEDDKFSIIYTIKNDEVNIIYNKRFSSDMKGCLISTPYIIDVNNDNKYEMITTCSYFDKLGIKTQIFELKKDKYNLVKEL